jgi:uncharacterized membrane protein
VPATIASILTGVGLVVVGGFSWTRSIWLLAAIALFSIAGAVWHWGLIPLRVRMGALVRSDGDEADVPPEYVRLARRWLSVNGAILALLGAILALMIWKPVLP